MAATLEATLEAAQRAEFRGWVTELESLRPKMFGARPDIEAWKRATSLKRFIDGEELKRACQVRNPLTRKVLGWESRTLANLLKNGWKLAVEYNILYRETSE